MFGVVPNSTPCPPGDETRERRRCMDRMHAFHLLAQAAGQNDFKQRRLMYDASRLPGLFFLTCQDILASCASSETK